MPRPVPSLASDGMNQADCRKKEKNSQKKGPVFLQVREAQECSLDQHGLRLSKSGMDDTAAVMTDEIHVRPHPDRLA